MAYREYIPPPALRPYVDRLWTTDGGAATTPARILPDGCIDVLISPGDGTIDVVGTMTRAVLVPPSDGGATIAVRFRPGRAAAFVGVAAHELTDTRARLSELGPHALRLDSLAGSTPSQALSALCEALVRKSTRLHRPLASDAWILHAIDELLAPSPPTVATLARDLGKSRQHVARVLRERVGLTPKELARIARMQRAIVELQASPTVDLATTALDRGYFDQAHMTRDFRLLAGVSPAGARDDAGSIFPIRSLFGRGTTAR